jgi:hypothetical protein
MGNGFSLQIHAQSLKIVDPLFLTGYLVLKGFERLHRQCVTFEELVQFAVLDGPQSFPVMG